MPSRGERFLLSCPVAARIWGHEAWSLEKAWWPCSYSYVITAQGRGSRWLPRAHWTVNPAKRQVSSLMRDYVLKAIRQSDRGWPISALPLASPMYVTCVCAHPHHIHTYTKMKSKRQGMEYIWVYTATHNNNNNKSSFSLVLTSHFVGCQMSGNAIRWGISHPEYLGLIREGPEARMPGFKSQSFYLLALRFNLHAPHFAQPNKREHGSTYPLR